MDIEFIILILTGMIGGCIMGLTGANGMAVFMSILLLINTPVLNAIGTCLFTQVIITSAIVFPLILKRNLNLKITLISIPAILIFSTMGAHMAFMIPGKLLHLLVIIALLTIGILLLKPKKASNDHGVAPKNLKNKYFYCKLFSLSSTSGFLFGLVGGGSNIVVINGLKHLLNLPYKNAYTTGLFFALCSMFFAFGSYWMSNQVLISKGLYIAIPGAIVAYMFSLYSMQISLRKINLYQGIYLITTAIILTLKY